jgi:hypothetical protein
MNIDTDTQYAFTRSVAGFMFSNYDGVLKVDGEVGNKKAYDPRAWGKVAETAMAARVVEATQQLGSAGTRSASDPHRERPRSSRLRGRFSSVSGAAAALKRGRGRCDQAGRRTRRAAPERRREHGSR